MSWLIHDGSTVVLDDVFEPEKGAINEADGGTRRMILRVASEAAALAQVSVGAAHPDYANLLCASGRVTRVIHCGALYAVEFPYKGLIASKSPVQKPVENLEGFDTATERRFVFAASEEDAVSGIALGASLTGHTYMICVDRQAEPIIEGFFYEAVFSFKGFLDTDKPVKYIPRGYAERQSSNSAFYPGQATPVPLESNQPLVGVTAIWASTTVPSCDVSGTNVTPDWSPGVPANIWSTIANPIHVYPYGWVIDSREPDIIAGSTVCLVTDQYTYYQRYKPGGES
jgi:hypothetical protein